jgi:hypothetical protein
LSRGRECRGTGLTQLKLLVCEFGKEMNEPKDETADAEEAEVRPLVEGEDYYLEGGLLVFTAAFLLRRGYCCESGCRHCPYGYTERADS